MKIAKSAASDPINYLGIDWGKQTLGLALAHAETRIALAIGTEENDAELCDRIADLIRREAIGTVVIGISRRMALQSLPDGTPVRTHGTGLLPAEAFGTLLAKQLAVEVFYADEMFTTRLAQKLLIERGEKQVGEKDDAWAASLILQEWLDYPRPQTK